MSLANGTFSLLITSTDTAVRNVSSPLGVGRSGLPTKPTADRTTEAAIFNLNRITSRPVELEEAWIIYALVIDDGLQQTEVAQMLGRHESRVNRRLALIERLCDEAREALRLGLLDTLGTSPPASQSTDQTIDSSLRNRASGPSSDGASADGSTRLCCKSFTK